MRIKHAPAATLIGAMVVTAVAGCGSTDSARSSKASFVARADATCARYEAQNRSIPRPPFNPMQATKSDLPAAATYLVQRLPVFRSESQALHALGAPAEEKATFGQALSGLDGSIAAQSEALTAARRGDLAAFEARIAKERAAGMRGSGLMQRFGLRVCGARRS